MPNKIRIKAFGMVAEKIGTSEMTLDYLGDSAKLLDVLQVKFPELKALKFTLAINKKIAIGHQEIPENAEVALLPPFSGG